MGKSRHKNLRSLQRYVHPSAEAVAAMTAAHDPAAPLTTPALTRLNEITAVWAGDNILTGTPTG